MTRAVVRGGLIAVVAYVLGAGVAIAVAATVGSDAAVEGRSSFAIGLWLLLALVAAAAAALGTWQAGLGGAPSAGAAMQVGAGAVLLVLVVDLLLGLGDPGYALARFVLAGLGAVLGAFLLGRRLEAA